MKKSEVKGAVQTWYESLKQEVAKKEAKDKELREARRIVA